MCICKPSYRFQAFPSLSAWEPGGIPALPLVIDWKAFNRPQSSYFARSLCWQVCLRPLCYDPPSGCHKYVSDFCNCYVLSTHRRWLYINCWFFNSHSAQFYLYTEVPYYVQWHHSVIGIHCLAGSDWGPSNSAFLFQTMASKMPSWAQDILLPEVKD